MPYRKKKENGHKSIYVHNNFGTKSGIESAPQLDPTWGTLTKKQGYLWYFGSIFFLFRKVQSYNA